MPVYLGPAEDFKQLVPHPKAVIFVADFDYNVTALGGYLTALSGNETAYEEHRHWRTTFSREPYVVGKPALITRSWHCRVCDWAARTQPNERLHQPDNTFTCSRSIAWSVLVLAAKVGDAFVSQWVLFAHLALAWVLCSVVVIVWMRRRRRRRIASE